MHHLDRSAAAVPACLARFRPGRSSWDDLTQEDRDEIRSSLEAMQGQICAYCEKSLVRNSHIEHFRRRSDFPNLTFDWSNLFWSCSDTDSCGIHKDRTAALYSPDDLIHPAADDPDHFFHFRENGAIRIESNLSDRDEFRAAETLRVLNLDADHGRLRAMRREVLRVYRSRDPDILTTLTEMEPAEARAYATAEVESTARDPFCTVIRHFFGGFQ